MKRLLVVGMTSLAFGCASQPGSDQPVLFAPHEGDYLWIAPATQSDLTNGGELQIFVDYETHPAATASFAKFTLGVGGSLPVHRHDKTEEFAYILSGEGMAVAINEEGNKTETPISAGYMWYNPPGVWHAVRNSGNTELSMVFTTVPNEKMGLLSFFRRICASPGKKGMVLSTEEFARIGEEHDLILRDAPSHQH